MFDRFLFQAARRKKPTKTEACLAGAYKVPLFTSCTVRISEDFKFYNLCFALCGVGKNTISVVTDDKTPTSIAITRLKNVNMI